MMTSCASPLALVDADSPCSIRTKAPQKALKIAIHNDSGHEEQVAEKQLPNLLQEPAATKLVVGGAGPDASFAQLAKELAKQQQNSQVDESHLASDAKTFVNAIISFLGSGVLGLPFAFSKCGILLGLTILIVVAVISTFCMLLIVKCKYKLKQQGVDVATYGQIGGALLGPTCVTVVNVALVVSQSGFGIAYLIFISTNAHQFFGFPKEWVVAACMMPLIGFSLLKHMKQLAYVALVADIMNFSGLFVVYCSDLAFMPLDHDVLQMTGVWSNMPFFFGVACYCFEGVGMVLPLENSMANKHHFTSILIATVVIITSIYATFGICGYLAFGNDTKDVITLNFESNDQGAGSQVAMIVKLLLCVGLFFTYPLMLFPVFEVVEPLVLEPKPLVSSHGKIKNQRRNQVHDDSDEEEEEAQDKKKQQGFTSQIQIRTEEEEEEEEQMWVAQQQEETRVLFKWKTRSCLLRASVVLLTGCLAAGIPNFGAFISFIGSTCCSLLAFVLPSLFALLLFRDSNGFLMNVFLSVLMGIGVISIASGVVDSLSQLMST